MRTTPRGLRSTVFRPALLCSLLLSIGVVNCTIDSTGGPLGAPMILPESARLGDTVAMVVANSEDSISAPGVLNNISFSASRDNLRINLVSATANATGIEPRAVVEIPAWLGSSYARMNQDRIGQSMKVVIFDVPTTGGGFDTTSFPFTVNVELIQEGVYLGGGYYLNIPTGFERELHIHAAGGTAIEFGVVSGPEQLEAQPMYRLAPTWSTAGGGRGIDPSWRIGSMEFTLEYNTSVGIREPQAYAGGSATGALVVVGDVVQVGLKDTVKIALIKPDGIDPFGNKGPCPNAATCYSPAPILDISFDKSNPPDSVEIGDRVFHESTFTLADFKMYDVNGALLQNTSGANNPNNYFKRAVVRNLRE